MKNIYIEVLNTGEHSVVELGKLGGQRAPLRSYSGKEAKYDALKFATVISEILNCPLLSTEVR